MRKKCKKTGGFSFVEVIIVIAIVGILVTLVHAALRTATKDASAVKLAAALQKVDEAKIRYYMDNKTTGAPPPAKLIQYLQAPAGAGEEIIYSESGWNTTHTKKATAGYLLKGVKDKGMITPNGKGVAAKWLPY